MPDWLKDSVSNDARKAVARTEVLTTFERIRLRLNKGERLHIHLEQKLREFIDEPLAKPWPEERRSMKPLNWRATF